MRRTLLPGLCAAAAFALVGCAEESPTAVSDLNTEATFARGGATAPPGDATIYQIAKGASMGSEPEFTVLVAALEASGLDAALDGKGQFTVFAPTDAAFTALFSDPDFPYTPEELLANTELLSTVLLYHVARGKRESGSVVTSDRIRMMAAGFNMVNVTGAGAFLEDTSALTDDAQIVIVDIPASNGVIHVIDAVLLP